LRAQGRSREKNQKQKAKEELPARQGFRVHG
jgi:hypothetical protein